MDLRVLRENAETRTLPVIVCTAAASSLAQVRGEIEVLGATILSKPFELDTLFTIVKRELR